jgi:hypothetical protein
MALIQKYDAAAAVKTHGLVDGTIVDLINPSSPLDSTGEMLRMATFGVIGWVGRGYKENKSFGF